MKMVRTAAILILVFLLAAPGALAKKPYWEGKPEFSAGEGKGYFLWHDGDGWHLRWTTKNRKHRFSGTISCDGAIQGFERVSRDDRRDVIKRRGRNTIAFDTLVAGGKDGVNFRLSPDTRTVRFDLRMDGVRVDVNRVKIGRNKRFPRDVPFTLDRNDR